MKSFAFGACVFACAATLHATVTEMFRQTYPLTADGVIQLENVNGAVEITTWDRPEVSLEAEKSAPDDDYLSRIHLVISASPDRLTIKTVYEKKWSLFGDTRGEVRYKLIVPAGVSLKKIDVVNSNIVVRGVRGPVELETVNGGIEATGLARTGHFTTVNGPITVRYEHLESADAVALNTVNGSCRLFVPKGAGFELDASSVNGGLSCDLPVSLEKSSHHHLRGTVGAGGPKVTLESVNGGLDVSAR